jgi:hypothetical protein
MASNAGDSTGCQHAEFAPTPTATSSSTIAAAPINVLFIVVSFFLFRRFVRPEEDIAGSVPTRDG